jgi:hypothetical protein
LNRNDASIAIGESDGVELGFGSNDFVEIDVIHSTTDECRIGEDQASEIRSTKRDLSEDDIVAGTMTIEDFIGRDTEENQVRQLTRVGIARQIADISITKSRDIIDVRHMNRFSLFVFSFSPVLIVSRS